MKMDMKIFIPSAQQEQMGNGTANVSDVYLEYPASMAAGDNLKDGQFTINSQTGGGMNSSIEVSITERKIIYED